MMWLDAFHFLRPAWLLALIPLLLIFLLLRYLQRHRSGWQNVLAPHLYQHLLSARGGLRNKPPLYLLGLAWVIACLALAGPTWERLPQPVYQLHTGKVVVMDMSFSMRATDITPDRLTRARYKAIDLIKQITEGETGLVAYAGDAFVISPLSTDSETLISLIPALSPEIMPVPGSDPQSGIQLAIELLQSAGYQEGEIFWLTDGVEMAQVAPITRLINQSDYRLSVLAVGTEEGAPISLQNGELMKDGSGSIVIPKLEADNLQLIARQGGGVYSALRADDSDIERLVNQALLSRDKTEEQQKEDHQGDQWYEAGPYLILLLLPLAAYGFRRGLLGIGLACLLFPTVYTPQVQASVWEDLWQRADQQGQQAFNQQEYESAAEKFDDPLWQGSAHYRNGDYDKALEAFARAEGPQAWYNRGNALAQLGQLEEAIEAYDKALEAQPGHEDARFNKALLEKQKQQQEEQQSQQQQSSDQNQQQDKDQQGESQDQQGQQSQKSSDQQDQNAPPESEQSEQSEQQTESQPEQQEQQDSQQQAEEKNASDNEESSEQPQATQAQEQPLTDEEREQQQRLEKLLRRVPDDPAYLLKRKMLLENQQRRRQSLPNRLQRNW
ncbi:VWA domain-containing protein [Lacimicrobium sp. SS2-24]|uniref:VWA domain-containing protein n=1 Tax=Lacimicrobium sp. SS2-24 TaxID=2005569 RepID=UPI000B4A6CB0|nr:VWA domain-containing protein [Lacimicrobium sp. SS2-24]